MRNVECGTLRSRMARRIYRTFLAMLATWLPASVVVAEEGSGIQTAVADGGAMEAVLFYLVAGTTVACGLGICLTKSVVRMAVWLFGTLGSVAVLYFMLSANFLGAIQLIVYAGGTLILLIFGVMLTSKSPWARFDIKGREFVASGAVALLLAGVFLTLLGRTFSNTKSSEVSGSSVRALGEALLTTYLVPFEVASVLLLVVMIGAAYLARQDKVG